MSNNSLIMLCVGLLLSCNSMEQSESGLQLSNESATKEAKELYGFLRKVSNKGFLIGHQDAVAYGIGWEDEGFSSDVQKVCGKYPALYGWDLGHIHDTYNIDSVPFQRMKDWAIEVNKRGGVNTYGWHALNFTSGGSSWDKTSCVADILPAGKYHYDFLRKLDRVAGFFKDLVDADGQLIPVIFRPWHEMNGSWFWWGEGNCSTEEYKQLWKFTYDYLSNNHQLNNIIWCYSTDAFKTEAEYLKYYPGDECVDILGFDDYQGISNPNRFSETIQRFEIVNKLAAEKGKIYALSETGSERIENPKWFTEILNGVLLQNESTKGAAYVLFWRNGRPDHFYASYPGHISAPDFVDFSNHASTIFLNDIISVIE